MNETVLLDIVCYLREIGKHDDRAHALAVRLIDELTKISIDMSDK